MGSFANSALNLMLGWMRGAAQWLWRLFDADQNGSALEWLGRHWAAVAIALCIAGVVIDFMVYLVRWRPDLVWRSFIRRISGKRGKRTADEASQQLLPQEDMESEEEGLSQPLAQQYEQQPYNAQQPLQQSYAQQAEADGQRPARHRRSERHQGEPQDNRAMTLLKKAGEIVFREEAEVTFQAYKPSKALPQADESKPYIPPQWQKPGE